MKKVSAFSVFKGKKEKGETPQIERDEPTRVSLKKASSTPNMGEDETTSKKIMRALKSGSFRATIRGNKHRPSILPNGSGDSPFVAGDASSVKLTAVKDKKTKSPKATTKKKLNGTPIPSKNSKISAVTEEDIESLKKLASDPNEAKEDILKTSPKHKSQKTATPKSAETSKTRSRQKKSKLSVPVPQLEETPKGRRGDIPGKNKNTTDSIQHTEPMELNGNHKGTGKRDLEDKISSPEKKRMRVDSPKASSSQSKGNKSPPQKPIRSVTPQRKNKHEKKMVETKAPKLCQTVEMEYMYDSQEEAKKCFECMIHPMQPDKFFSELWQKKPLLLRRRCSTFNDGWFSTAEFDRILTEENVEFGKHLDVTMYKDGKRETHNPAGRAHRSVVWDFYQNDCSVRLLNPQTYSKTVWEKLSVLQEYFGCYVGANVYLTPPGTQGFAPHYDDIEAFILQLEGKKHWRLYSPRSEEETLPRTSSGNFDESEIGTPILDITLQAGDLLYFPRGTIHQGRCLEDAHSLHITVSCFQKNTWGDLLEKLVPRALSMAMEEDVEFREGLPTDYLNYMGIVHFDKENPQRETFSKKISSLMTKMIQYYLPIDASCDQMGRHFVRHSMPPVLTAEEKSCSIHGNGSKWDGTNMCVKEQTEIDADTMIKLIRKGAIRMALEDEIVRIYYNLDNARIYEGNDEQYLDIKATLAPDVEYLIDAYPEYVAVENLPSSQIDDRVGIATLLYEQGLIVTGEPLEPEDAST